MDIKEGKWLEHLKEAVPKKGYEGNVGNQSRYLIALEGWRRGIRLKFFRESNSINFSLEHDGKKHIFSTSFGDLTTNEAKNIAINKELTKQYLSKAGLPIAKGESFDKNVKDENIIKYATNLTFPLVIKPINGVKGKGVVANIQDVVQFKKALTYVRYELGFLDIIVEQHIKGQEMRVFFLEDKVIAAYKKEPAYIIGDGINTIEMLIKYKNLERKKNPHLNKRLIKIDTDLLRKVRNSGFTLNSVLNNNYKLCLREQSNINTGGELIDCTDKLPKEVINIAQKVGKAIPGLVHGGIDMIVNREGIVVILEINHNAALGGHLYPAKGLARDIPKEIIDYYFPSTKKDPRSTLYFDYKSVLEPLKNKSAEEVVLPQIQVKEIFSKRYIVSGEVHNVGYRKWIRKQAIKNNLNGFTKNLKNEKVLVVVASSDRDELERFQGICAQGSKRSKVKEVKEKRWNKPVRIGFEIKKSKK